MRSVVIDDGRLALAGGKKLQHTAQLRPRAAARQLAVAEGAGAAFAKEIVAFRIERSAGIEGMNVADALTHRRSALEHERLVSLLSEEIAGDESCGAGADNHGAMPKRLSAERRELQHGLVALLDYDVAALSSPRQRGQAFLILGRAH